MPPYLSSLLLSWFWVWGLGHWPLQPGQPLRAKPTHLSLRTQACLRITSPFPSIAILVTASAHLISIKLICHLKGFIFHSMCPIISPLPSQACPISAVPSMVVSRQPGSRPVPSPSFLLSACLEKSVLQAGVSSLPLWVFLLLS